MTTGVPIPYVALAPDEPGAMDALFLFERFNGVTFINPSSDVPHRHTFQELIFVEDGLLRHSVDDQYFEVGSHTLVLVTSGQVHVVDRAIELTGWQLRFADAFLPNDESGAWPDPAVAIAQLGPSPALALHAPDLRDLNAVAGLIEAEWLASDRPDRDAALRHLLAVLLIRVGRIQTAAGANPAAREEQRIYRAFMALLDRDVAAHHDVTHYAAALDLTPVRLSAILARVLGKPTKRVIDERLVLEAKRLLRFTDQTLGEIAASLGYSDQFHLSKTFKRVAGVTPQAFRQHYEKVT